MKVGQKRKLYIIHNTSWLVTPMIKALDFLDTCVEVITSEREARSEFLLIYTKNLSMSGRPARRPAGPPAGRGHAFERLISLEP